MTTTGSVSSGISIAERDRFRSIFNSLGPIDSVVTGDQCRSVFLQSEVPQTHLQRIWELADLDQDGALDIEEFIIAMRLIYDTLNGIPVPSTLPDYMIPPIKAALRRINPNVDPLARAAGVPGIPTLASMVATVPGVGIMSSSSMGSIGPDQTVLSHQLTQQLLRGPSIEFTDDFDWYMSPAQKLKYELEFERAPTVNGLLAKHHAYEAFVLSRRPNDEFDVVWSIIDLHGQGSISMDQYVCMQHILNARKGNQPFPRSLPPEVIAKFTSVPPSHSTTPNLSRATSSKGMTSIGCNIDDQVGPTVVTVSDDAKIQALQEEVAFLQQELDKMNTSTEANQVGKISLVAEYTDRASKIQNLIDWINEHLPLLPTNATSGTDVNGDSGNLELTTMLAGLKDELTLAEAQYTREKSTMI